MVFLMVFRQGTRYFLKCSTIKRNSRAFGFFMELPPPLAHHNQHYHPPLSPPPLSQPPQLTKASFSHLPRSFFWGKSCTKASFSHLLRSIFEGSLARKLHFHVFRVQFLREVLRESFIFTSSTFSSNNSFRKHLSLAMSCACLLLLEEQRAPRTTAFQRAMGRVWPIGIMWFFGYRFVIVRVIVWDTWFDQENLQNNDSGKPFFWNFLMLLEQSLRLPRKTKSTNSKRNRGKSGIYSTHAVPAARRDLAAKLFFPSSSMARCH